MYDMLSRCFLRCFCVYSLADSGERRKPRRTRALRCPGGQDKECVLKLSWPSTAEYRMKLEKKNPTTRTESPGQCQARVFGEEVDGHQGLGQGEAR